MAKDKEALALNVDALTAKVVAAKVARTEREPKAEPELKAEPKPKAKPKAKAKK